MPVVSSKDGFIGQSVAINYYIASSLGLMGKNNFEAAQILAIQEHIKELKTSFYGILPYGQPIDEEKLKMFFTEGSKNVTGATNPMDQKDRSSRYMTWYLSRIETVVGANGYAVGSATSLADVLIYNAFAETLSANETQLSEGSSKMEPFHSA